MDKYLPLTKWLLENNKNKVTLSFSRIEEIISSKLPESAYRHRTWWANNKNHPQANAWMASGYYTSDCSDLFTERIVIFSKE